MGGERRIGGNMKFDKSKIHNIFIHREAWPSAPGFPLRVSIDKIPAILGNEKRGVLFVALGLEEVATIIKAFENLPNIEIGDGVATIEDTTIVVPVKSICSKSLPLKMIGTI